MSLPVTVGAPDKSGASQVTMVQSNEPERRTLPWSLREDGKKKKRRRKIRCKNMHKEKKISIDEARSRDYARHRIEPV
jgi:hypothetical protein